MPFHSAGLTAREKKNGGEAGGRFPLSGKYLLAAERSRRLDALPVVGPSKSPKDQELRHYLWINGSRFDLIDENRPFVGITPMPPGRGFYPEGLTRKQIEQYVQRSSREERGNLQFHHDRALARRST